MISLVLGLGNIGEQYRQTRHNLGFRVVDGLAVRLRADKRHRAEHSVWTRAGENLLLAWPTTYMTRSGLAAAELVERFSLKPEEMLVVVDDYHLPLGRLRVRSHGSDGGHNGLASIADALGTENFPRLRLGIGPAPDNTDSVDFVLSRFSDDECDAVTTLIGTAVDAVLFTIDQGLDRAMGEYNRNPA